MKTRRKLYTMKCRQQRWSKNRYRNCSKLGSIFAVGANSWSKLTFHSSWCLDPNWSLFVFKRVEKIKKRRSLWDWLFIFISIPILVVFPRVFLCVFNFQTLFFPHTWAYLSILSIRIYIVGKISLWLLIPPSVVTFHTLWYPSSKGDCVDIPLVRGDCESCVPS